MDESDQKSKNPEPGKQENHEKKKKRGMEIEGYRVEGLSIGGHETCIIFPTLNLAFDIGRCPQRALSQDFLFISHGHMDHIGGLPMYVATRGLYGMKPPTIIIPTCLKEDVEKLFEVHRKMDRSELKHNLIGLDVGEEFILRRDLKVRAFRTFHVIPSQGYVVYSIKQKLKEEYLGLSGNEIKNLKLSGVEITNTTTAPEVAFTGDTTSDFVADEANLDVLRAKILIVESTFVDNSVSVEHARDYGHVHLSEIINYADKFKNRAILLIHFSARYALETIQEAVSALPSPLSGRVFALTEGNIQKFYSQIGNVHHMHARIIEMARIRPSPWKQATVAVGSALGALLDPRGEDLIAALGETTVKHAFEKVLERMKRNPEGRVSRAYFDHHVVPHL